MHIQTGHVALLIEHQVLISQTVATSDQNHTKRVNIAQVASCFLSWLWIESVQFSSCLSKSLLLSNCGIYCRCIHYRYFIAILLLLIIIVIVVIIVAVVIIIIVIIIIIIIAILPFNFLLTLLSSAGQYSVSFFSFIPLKAYI